MFKNINVSVEGNYLFTDNGGMLDKVNPLSLVIARDDIPSGVDVKKVEEDFLQFFSYIYSANFSFFFVLAM